MVETIRLKRPRQERSRETLSRIVLAALALLEREGVEALTVQRVVDEAGSSVGSFYARFKGKDDLLLYLARRLWDEPLERWSEWVAGETWRALTFHETIRGVVGLLIQTRRAATLQRRLTHEGPEAVGRDARRFLILLVADVERILRSHADAMAHEDPAVAVDLGLRAVMATLAALESPSAQDGPAARLPDDALADELTRMLETYLAGSSEPADDDGQMEFFDIWA